MTFALGIGANAAMFSVVYGVLLRPLPYRESSSVVVVQGRDRLTGRVSPAGFSGPDLNDWKQRADFFESIALCSRIVFALETSSGFETVRGALVSADFFTITGAPMLLGRPSIDSRAAEIVISARLWRQSFAADPQVIGRQVRLNSQPYTIVGVVRNDFELPLETRGSLGAPAAKPHIWAPSELQSSIADRKQRSFYFVGRLRPDVSITEAQPMVESVAASIASDFPATNQRWEPALSTLSDELTGAIRPGPVGVSWRGRSRPAGGVCQRGKPAPRSSVVEKPRDECSDVLGGLAAPARVSTVERNDRACGSWGSARSCSRLWCDSHVARHRSGSPAASGLDSC